MSAPALRVVPAAPRDRDEELFAEWELFALAAGWSTNTIEMRRTAVQQMHKHTGASLLDVTPVQLAKWLARYSTPATRSTYYAGANAVLTWMHKMGHRADNPLAAIPRPKEKRGPRGQ
jgi:site-specific recombinase XerD